MPVRMTTRILSLVFIIACILVLTIFLAYQFLVQEQSNQLRLQAKALVGNVEAFGVWVAKQGGVWVFAKDSSSFLSQRVLVDPKNPEQLALRAFSKNPALAQREFSEVVMESASPAKFRMTSHNVMNPVNAPDAFEVRAIASMQATQLKEYSEVIGDKYRYAQAIVHKASCINCHGDPAKAPVDVLHRYGDKNGFGFKEGDVAGVISVSIPNPNPWQNFVQSIGVLELALVASIFMLLLIMAAMALSLKIR